MHIAFQRSGGRSLTGGRGEYEAVGSHSGYTAISLEGWAFNLRWPDGLVRETGLRLEPAESGKPRLRSLLQPPFQVGRMLAAMLMLPDPRRAYGGTGSGTPVAVAKKYVLQRVGFGPDTEFSPVVDLVTIDPSFVELHNQTDSESIGVGIRWKRVETVYEQLATLPSLVAEKVNAHRQFLASETVVDARLTRVVSDLSRAIEQSGLVEYTVGDDPLPALERLAGLPSWELPTLPSPDELTEDEPDITARAAHQYRLAKMRGPEARKFAVAVRQAYKQRCAFCGSRYGGAPGILSGIDAAHILAWSKHDLDVVPNGIALCKLHHWAFDAAILMPFFENGTYRLRFTVHSLQIEPASLSRLAPKDFVIPEAWLPADKSEWPGVKYLQTLYNDLDVMFVA